MTNYYSDIVKNTDSFFLIAGPCVVEDEDLCRLIADKLAEITNKLGIPFIFKASFRKANRSSLNSYTGLGDIKALEILARIRADYNLPVLTDIHETSDAEKVAEFVDYIQIPAFLCRQTDLLIAAAKTGKIINIKKGQFLAPDQMSFAIEKIKSAGNDSILLTERGNSFGYQDLIVDYRAIPIMKKTGFPVVFDASHSLQKPNSSDGVTGGQPEFIPTLCRAAIAAGADGLFIETHPNPSEALSDGANMLDLDKMNELLTVCKRIHTVL